MLHVSRYDGSASTFKHSFVGQRLLEGRCARVQVALLQTSRTCFNSDFFQLPVLAVIVLASIGDVCVCDDVGVS